MVMVLLACLAFSFSAQAKTQAEGDYILGDDRGEQIAIPTTYECMQVIEYIEGYTPASGDVGRLNNPQDIFIDRDNNIYGLALE
jgi:hypothetical protein